MSRPNWISGVVEIDGEQFSVEYLVAEQIISVRVISPGGGSSGITSYYKGDIDAQLKELTRDLMGRE